MKITKRQSSKLKLEEVGKVEIEKLEKEILELKGEKREERMKAYRGLLSSSAEQSIYFLRSE